MIPIFVITLPGDEKRRQGLVGQLERHGLPFELLYGVDARRGLPAEYEQQIDREGTILRCGRRLSDGEYACALSHQRAYEEIGRRRLPGAVILEDDVSVGEQFATFMRTGAYRKADMLLLFHHNAWVRRALPVQVTADLKGYRIALPPYSTAGYSVSSKAARLIRHRSLPLAAPADWPCNIARLHCLAVEPQPVKHPPLADRSASHIDAGRSAMAGTKVIPPFRRLRLLFSIDEWHARIGRRTATKLRGAEGYPASDGRAVEQRAGVAKAILAGAPGGKLRDAIRHPKLRPTVVSDSRLVDGREADAVRMMSRALGVAAGRNAKTEVHNAIRPGPGRSTQAKTVVGPKRQAGYESVRISAARAQRTPQASQPYNRFPTHGQS